MDANVQARSDSRYGRIVFRTGDEVMAYATSADLLLGIVQDSESVEDAIKARYLIEWTPDEMEYGKRPQTQEWVSGSLVIPRSKENLDLRMHQRERAEKYLKEKEAKKQAAEQEALQKKLRSRTCLLL